MKRILIALLLVAFCCNTFAQFRSTRKEIVVLKKDTPLDYLSGRVYLGKTDGKKLKYTKLKNVTPDIFDYCFIAYEGMDGANFLWPLSSGKYENKECPTYDVIKIQHKLNPREYQEFCTFVNTYFYRIDFGNFENSEFTHRYSGTSYGEGPYKKEKGFQDLSFKYNKGLYYSYYYNYDTYIKGRDVNTLKTKENAKDLELMNQKHGYEMLFDESKNIFGVVDITTGSIYWGDNAIAYLDKNYLNSYCAEEEAREAARKTAEEREKAYPCGWAYFSDKGKGNIKFKFDAEVEGRNSTIVLSGFKKDDNVIDEVFVLPPSDGTVQTNPSIAPDIVKDLFSYYQQGVNFHQIEAYGENYKLSLSTTKDILLYLDSILNKDGKWVNNTGLRYSFRDRWGKYHYND